MQDSFITDTGERLRFPDFSCSLLVLNTMFPNKTHLKIQHVSSCSEGTWAIVSALTGQIVFQNTCKIKIGFKQKLSVRANKDSRKVFSSFCPPELKTIKGFARQKLLLVQGIKGTLSHGTFT